jgi:16S rRNA U1498 N3-methylase RsmE
VCVPEESSELLTIVLGKPELHHITAVGIGPEGGAAPEERKTTSVIRGRMLKQNWRKK